MSSRGFSTSDDTAISGPDEARPGLLPEVSAGSGITTADSPLILPDAISEQAVNNEKTLLGPDPDSEIFTNPAWEKVNPEMARTLGVYVAKYPCAKRLMFGSPVYFVRDRMWTGIKGNVVFLHLDAVSRTAVSQLSPEIIAFEPRPGRLLKEYVAMPESLLNEASFFSEWLEQAYQTVIAMPDKSAAANTSEKPATARRTARRATKTDKTSRSKP